MYQGKFDSKNKKTAVDVSELVAQRNSAPSQEQPQRQPVREMAQFIHDHFDQELTLDQIAASAALSPGACCRLFKRHMGCSPFTYVQNLRLQRAARLLETTDEPITQVAARCGYGSPSYFTKSFREKTGLSPSAYRKRLPGEDPRD